MQKAGLSDAEVCPSGPMPDKKLCKAVNFHYTGSVLRPTFNFHYSTLAVYYAARNCGSFLSSWNRRSKRETLCTTQCQETICNDPVQRKSHETIYWLYRIGSKPTLLVLPQRRNDEKLLSIFVWIGLIGCVFHCVLSDRSQIIVCPGPDLIFVKKFTHQKCENFDYFN